MIRKGRIGERPLRLWLLAQRVTQAESLARGRLLQGLVEDEQSVPAAHIQRRLSLKGQVDLPLMHLQTVLQDGLDDIVAKFVPHEVAYSSQCLVDELNNAIVAGSMLKQAAHDAATKSVLGSLNAVAPELLDDEVIHIRRLVLNDLLDNKVAVGRSASAKHGASKLIKKRDHILM